MCRIAIIFGGLVGAGRIPGSARAGEIHGRVIFRRVKLSEDGVAELSIEIPIEERHTP